MGLLSSKKRRYVLITSARNEESYIKETIESVQAQTELPEKWVVVDDNSDDGTGELVLDLAKNGSFIELVRAPEKRERNFASKVAALNMAYRRIKKYSFDYIGNLDADMTLGSDYFKRILDAFEEDEKLGVGGGFVYEELGRQIVSRRGNTVRSVAGGVQFFRRKCFEEIGGYIPLKYGCEDAAAEFTARMKNWNVRSFPDIKAFHQRNSVSNGMGTLKRFSQQGKAEYVLGYHPLFEMAKCIRRSITQPYIMGSLARIYGYVWALMKEERSGVPDDLVAFLRKEHMKIFKSLFKRDA
jgi:glycosyltransferase involved in cell wall biosynthesis